MQKRLSFEKDPDGRWYIILDYHVHPGPRSKFEMVMGADTMLDILSQGEDLVHTLISDEPRPADFKLTSYELEYEGMWYNLIGDHHDFEVWLCEVTKSVFGRFPSTLYIKVSS